MLCGDSMKKEHFCAASKDSYLQFLSSWQRQNYYWRTWGRCRHTRTLSHRCPASGCRASCSPETKPVITVQMYRHHDHLRGSGGRVKAGQQRALVNSRARDSETDCQVSEWNHNTQFMWMSWYHAGNGELLQGLDITSRNLETKALRTEFDTTRVLVVLSKNIAHLRNSVLPWELRRLGNTSSIKTLKHFKKLIN